MADILITVGVDQELSYKEFQQGIKNLVNSINRTPPEIKLGFDFDEASIKAVRTQINELNKSILGMKTPKGFNLKTIPGASIAKNTAEINRNTEAKRRNAQSEGKLTDSIKKRNDAFLEAVEILNKLNSSESKSSSNAKKSFSDNDLKEYANMLKKVDRLVDNLLTKEEKLRGAQKSSSSNEYENIKTYLSMAKNLREKVQTGDISFGEAEKVNTLIEALAADSATSIKIAKDNTAQLTLETKEYYNALRSIDRSSKQIGKNKLDWAGAEYSDDSNIRKAYNDYVKLEGALEKLRGEVESGKLSVKELNTALAEIQATEARVSAILSGSKDASPIITKDTDRYFKVVKELEKSKAQVAKNKEDWASAADSGDIDVQNAFSEYSALEKKIDSLTTKLNEGRLSINEYNTALAEIQATEARLARTIKPETIIKSGTDEFTQAEEKIERLLRKAVTLRDSSTKAKGGRAKDSFKALDKEIIPQIKEFAEALQNNRLTEEKYAEGLDRLSTAVSKHGEKIKVAGENTKSFLGHTKDLASRFASWLTASQLIMYAYNSAKQMVSAAIEIESAMAQIQIVTGSTDSQMETFLTKSISLAKELGRSVTDAASSIETFARLGYNLEDATELSKYANIMANVGNTDIDTATTGITSIIKGYQLNPDDAEHVADVLVEVGQKYAISAEELMAAFQRGGAALHASGTDFEKSAALFAATNASLQNAETTGVMWKTVSARIRGAKTELEEMGETTDDVANGFSKYREEIQSLSGVDIMKDANTYKDLFDIFVELASVWENMTDVSQARVAEILGGTRNTSGVMSTITNINDALGAYEDAMDSAGTATEANAIYMDTTQAKLGELKAAFQELSADFLSSDFTKGVVSFLTTVVESIDKIINALGSLETILLGLGIFKTAKWSKNVLSGLNTESRDKIKNLLKEKGVSKDAFTEIFDVLKTDKSVEKLASKFSDVQKAMSTASAEGKGALAALSSGANVLFGALAPLVPLVTFIGGGFLLWQAYDGHLKQQAAEAREASTALNETATSLTDYKNRITELRNKLDSGTLSEQEAYNAKSELLSIQQALSDSYGDQVDGINLVNGSMREQIRLIDEVAQKNATQFLVENKDGIEKSEKEMTRTRAYAVGSYKPGDDDATSKAIDKSIEDLKEKYGDIINVGKEVGGKATISITGDASQAKEVLEALRADIIKIENDVGENDILTGLLDGVDENLGHVGKVLGEYEQIYNTAKDARLAADTKGYEDLNGEVKTATEWMREYQSAVDKYNTALASGDSTKISIARREFEAIDASIQSLLGADMGKYADSFNGISAELNTTAINARKLENIINGVGVQDNTGIIDTNVKKYSDAYNNLANEQKKIEEWGLEKYGNAFDTSGKSFVQSKFGNVNMDKRTIITWSDELKNTYKEALDSWDYDPEIGGIDTVFGGSSRFGRDVLEHGVEVAFTPIMNIDGKAKFLDQNTVYDYINELVRESMVDGVFSEEKMLSLDKEGRQVGSTFVKGIIAATDEGLDGKKAKDVSKLMHFSGDYGAIALAYKDIDEAAKEAGISTEEFLDAFKNTDKTSTEVKKTADALKELKLDDKDFINIFETKDIEKGEKEIKKFVDIALEAGIISDTSSESLQDLADILVELGIISGAPIDSFKEITTGLQNATVASKGFVDEVSSLQQVLSAQHSGKSISISDFNSEALDGYREAFEYTNGTMQINIEKTREIAKTKAEEQVATNNANKAIAQGKYIDNARQIEIYRKKIEEANFAKGETAASVQASIDALLAENSTIADMCQQYDLLSLSVQEAVGAYQHWLNAQNSSDYGDMADDAVSAIQRIRDTYDSNSDIFRQFGSRKFDAAVEFIIPESIDKEDLEAIELYMADFQKYLNFGENGAIDSLNIDQFLQKSVEAGLMSYSDDEGFKILGGKKMADFAEGLNMSSGLVQAFFDELQLYDGKFDWGDEVVKTTGDLMVAANEAAEELKKLDENKDLKIKLDYSDLKTTDEQLEMLDNTIAEMDEIKSRVNVDPSDVERANAIIQYCLDQKYLLTQPDVLRVDTSKVEGDLGEAISLLQEFHETQNQLEIQTKIGVDTSLTQEKLDSLLAEIQGLSPKIKADLGIDSASVDTVKQSIAGLSANTLIKVGVAADAITGYDEKTKEVDVIYNPVEDKLPKSFKAINRDVKYKPKGHKDLPEEFKSITRTVNYVAVGDIDGGKPKPKPKKPKKKDEKGGGHGLNGTAHSSGTAKAGGDWGTAPGGRTLVGELG